MEQDRTFRLTPEAARVIEEIIHRRNKAEVKVEDGQLVVIEVRRKRKL